MDNYQVYAFQTIFTRLAVSSLFVTETDNANRNHFPYQSIRPLMPGQFLLSLLGGSPNDHRFRGFAWRFSHTASGIVHHHVTLRYTNIANGKWIITDVFHILKMGMFHCYVGFVCDPMSCNINFYPLSIFHTGYD